MKSTNAAVSNHEIDTLLSSMSTMHGNFPIIDAPIQHRRVWNLGERPIAKMDVSQTYDTASVVPDLPRNTDTPDSTVTQEQRLRKQQYGTLVPTDGTFSLNDGTLAPSDGSVAPSDGTLAPSDGSVASSDGTLAPRDETLAPSNGTLAPNAESLPRDLLTSRNKDDKIDAAILPTRLSLNPALTTDLMGLGVLRSLGHKTIFDARVDTELALDNMDITQVMIGGTRRRFQGNVPLGFPFNGKRVNVVASVNLPTVISKVKATENVRPRFDVKIPDLGKRKDSVGVTIMLQPDTLDKSSNVDSPITESRGPIIRYDVPMKKHVEIKPTEESFPTTMVLPTTVDLQTTTVGDTRPVIHSTLGKRISKHFEAYGKKGYDGRKNIIYDVQQITTNGPIFDVADSIPKIKYDNIPYDNKYRHGARKGLDIAIFDYHTTPSFKAQPSKQVATVMGEKKKMDSKTILTTKAPASLKLDIPITPELQILEDKMLPDNMVAVEKTKYITASIVHSTTPRYQRPKESIQATSLSYDVQTGTANIDDGNMRLPSVIQTTRYTTSHIKVKDVENIQPNFYGKNGRKPNDQHTTLSEIISVTTPFNILTTPKPTKFARVSKRLKYKDLQAAAKKILQNVRARIDHSKRIQHAESDKGSRMLSVQSVRSTRQNVGTRKPSFDVPRNHSLRRTGQISGTRKPSFDVPRHHSSRRAGQISGTRKPSFDVPSHHSSRRTGQISGTRKPSFDVPRPDASRRTDQNADTRKQSFDLPRPVVASRWQTASSRRHPTPKRQDDKIQSSRRKGPSRKASFIGAPRSEPPLRSGHAHPSRSSVPRQRIPQRKPRPTDRSAHTTRASTVRRKRPVTVAKPPSPTSRKAQLASRSSRTKQTGSKHRVKTVPRRRKPVPTSRTSGRVSVDRVAAPIRKRKPIPTVKTASHRRRDPDHSTRMTTPKSRRLDRETLPSSSRRGSDLSPQQSRRRGPERRTTFDVQRPPTDPWHQPVPNEAFPQDPIHRRDPWDFAVDMFSQPFPGSMDAFFPGAFGFMGPPLFNGPLHDQWPSYQPDLAYGAEPHGWGYPKQDTRPIKSRTDRIPDSARRPPVRQRESTQQRSSRMESTRQRRPSGQRVNNRRPADVKRRQTSSVNKEDKGSPPNRFDRPQSRRRSSASRSRNTRPPADTGRSRQRQSSGRQQNQHSRRNFQQNRADFPQSNQWSPFPYSGVPDWNNPPPPTQNAHRPFYETPFAYSDLPYGSQSYLPQEYHYPGEQYSPWQSAQRPYQDWPRQHRPQPPSNKYPLPMYDGASPSYYQRRGGQISPFMLHLMDVDIMPVFGGGSMIEF